MAESTWGISHLICQETIEAHGWPVECRQSTFFLGTSSLWHKSPGTLVYQGTETNKKIQINDWSTNGGTFMTNQRHNGIGSSFRLMQNPSLWWCSKEGLLHFICINQVNYAYLFCTSSPFINCSNGARTIGAMWETFVGFLLITCISFAFFGVPELR